MLLGNRIISVFALAAILLVSGFGINSVFANHVESGTGEIHGTKWLDTNGDGIFDATEVGFAGIPIQLFGTATIVSTSTTTFVTHQTFTDTNGEYWFTGLEPGDYHVAEIITSNLSMVQTFPSTGSYDVILTDGQIANDLDFGNEIFVPNPPQPEVGIPNPSYTHLGLPAVLRGEGTYTKNVGPSGFDHCGVDSPVAITLQIETIGGTHQQPMTNTDLVNEIWAATFPPILENSIADLTFFVDCPGPDDEIQLGGQIWIYIDPSGQIIDSCSGTPIEGATVTLTAELPPTTGNFVIPPTIFHVPATNPQITGLDGQYRWDVIAGNYMVTVEKTGFITKDSPVVTIPPPVTDLDILLDRIVCPNVENDSPTAIANGPYLTSIQTPVNLNSMGSFDPEGALLDFEWSTSTSFCMVNNSVLPNITCTKTGIFDVTLTVTDPLGLSHSDTSSVIVYDPTGGFVTGGGWINSPTGAYTADPSIEGKATFGFVSKYKKGASEPSGKTEFQFKTGNLNFHSSSYDWLVIAGHQAKYKGEGVINGAGNYGFMLSAVDAKLTPSIDDDLFRIKIWDKDNGDTVVYDNQFGAADDETLTTAIAGGSILIHKGK